MLANRVRMGANSQNIYDFSTDFNSYPVGAEPSGWVRASLSNNVLFNIAIDEDRPNEKFLRGESTTTTESGAFYWDEIGDLENFILEGEFRTSGNTGSNRSDISISLGTYIYSPSSNRNTLFGFRRESNINNVLVIGSGKHNFSWKENVWYNIRLKKELGNVSVSIWESTQVDPQSYKYFTALENSMYIGFGSNQMSNGTKMDLKRFDIKLL